MSYLEADVNYKKKDAKKKGEFLDRRKFRSQQTEDEKTFKNILESFEKFGFTDSAVSARELMNIKNIHQLNKDLLVLSYLYFQEKSNTFEEIQKNFDEDFEEILKQASSVNIFKKLFSKNLFYYFRQDFIMYLFLLNDYYQQDDMSSEESEFQSSFSSDQYYDDGFDPKDEDVYEEIEKIPKDELDYAD